MKYCVVIMDGAAGWPLPERKGLTSLGVARTPNLDALVATGLLGKVRTVPQGMEPSSACACMAILGYDPAVYYQGRTGIEASSLGVSLEDGDAIFRCNLVALQDGRMWSYSAGRINTAEGHKLIASVQESLGSSQVRFYPGISYRNLCVIKGHEETLEATCTAPHDIPNRRVQEYLPKGPGSELLRQLMARSEAVLARHPVNYERRARGDIPATTVWLFWGARKAPDLPPFRERYGLSAALTSGVDLLRGMAGMAGILSLDIAGVTDSMDNDYAAQAEGALAALRSSDLAVIHVEAPDEAGHEGSVRQKVEAIEKIDREIIGRLRSWRGDDLRIMVLPDHATPIAIQTHGPEPVPFLLWGDGLAGPGEAGRAKRFTEAEADRTGVFVAEGHSLMGRLLAR